MHLFGFQETVEVTVTFVIALLIFFVLIISYVNFNRRRLFCSCLLWKMLLNFKTHNFVLRVMLQLHLQWVVFRHFVSWPFPWRTPFIVILNSLLKIRVYVLIIEVRLFTVDSSCYSNGYKVIKLFLLKEKIINKNIVYTTVFQRQLWNLELPFMN